MNMLRRKFYNHPSNINWEKYRVERNNVCAIRKKSIRNYYRVNV